MDWLQAIKDDYGRVVVCIDDADLVAGELSSVSGAWSHPGSDIVLVLASNDRLWWRHAAHLSRRVSTVLFHGITAEDAQAISLAWSANGVFPAAGVGSSERDPNVLGDLLYQAATRGGGAADETLFGAVLHVRFGSGLRDRVQDLLSKLAGVKVRPESDVTLSDIFGIICLLQVLFDPQANLSRGASRELLAATVQLPGVYADGRMLALLGREAAITFAGARIYARHVSIARGAVDALRTQGGMERVAELAGRAGGRLRAEGAMGEGDFTGGYLLCRRLTAKSEALAAARGAVAGASLMLEPRVTSASVLRRYDKEAARRYVAALAAHLDEYRDRGYSVRGYLTEFSVVARSVGESTLALGLSALALHDGVGYALDRKKAQYALLGLVKAAIDVRRQNQDTDGRVPETAAVLMERVVDNSAQADQHLAPCRAELSDLDSTRTQSSDQLCGRLARAVSSTARNAVTEASLPFEHFYTLELGDLSRAARP